MANVTKSTRFDYLNIDEDIFATIVQDFLNLAYVSFEEIRKEHIDLAKVAKLFCTTLFPYSKADAVAITDSKNILAYLGYMSDKFPENSPIRTEATHEALRDGKSKTILSREEIGLADEESQINAAIIEVISIYDKPVGTLKLYYKNPEAITRSQHILAEALVTLISALLTSGSVEHQQELNRIMEVKMLQSQINPHFLFNTINTISSFIRTDPNKARDMLREFASFYRATLEQDSVSVPLVQEIENSKRYVKIEQARFGEDRLKLKVDIDESLLKEVELPPFILQPIVENSIIHAMPAKGCLEIQISAKQYFDYVKLDVSDNGCGMDKKTLENLSNLTKSDEMDIYKLRHEEEEINKAKHPKKDKKSKNLGLAMSNVYDRLLGRFGRTAKMQITSEVGKGTTVSFKIPLFK